MEKKDFDTIMGEITAGLTGDSSIDMQYLRQKTEEYRDSDYAQEIARACGRLIFSIMPEEDKAKLEQLVQNHVSSVSSVIEEAQFNMFQRKFDVAHDMLAKMTEKLEALNMYQDDAVSEYHTFNSPVEEVIYVNLYEPKKDIRRATEPYSILYLTLGSVLFELGEIENAKLALEKAIRWNPIDPQITFEYAEIHKKQGDLEKFLQLTKIAFSHSYSEEHLARCYRNFGYYFIEKKLWKGAAGCYMFSTQFDQDSKQAQSELWYIEQNAGTDFAPPTEEEIVDFFREHDIPIGASHDIVEILLGLGNSAKEADAIDFARHCYELAYGLTGAEQIKAMLDEFPKSESNPNND